MCDDISGDRKTHRDWQAERGEGYTVALAAVSWSTRLLMYSVWAQFGTPDIQG